MSVAHDLLGNLVSDCDVMLGRQKGINPELPWSVLGLRTSVLPVVLGWQNELAHAAAQIDVDEPPPGPPALVFNMTTREGLARSIGYVRALRAWASARLASLGRRDTNGDTKKKTRKRRPKNPERLAAFDRLLKRRRRDDATQREIAREFVVEHDEITDESEIERAVDALLKQFRRSKKKAT